MTEKVVYLLGAGFSAPLGIPVMGDFLMRSKDMFASEPKKYAYFEQVFDAINRMAVIKNYYRADLFNIEEILSTLEIDAFLGGEALADDFRNYICDVIDFHTPELSPYHRGRLPNNWHRFAFGRQQWEGYGYFFTTTFGLTIKPAEGSPTGVMAQLNRDPAADYSLITLNYDQVPEMVSQFLNKGGVDEGPHGFAHTVEDLNDAGIRTPLAKLHGSVETREIIPPTWSKGTHSDIAPVWELAEKLLSEANHIRILGYSLPINDAYVRYLLKSAAMTAPHLKRIDVVVLDTDGAVQQRYDDFIMFRNYRFAGGRTEDYLGSLLDKMIPSGRRPQSDWFQMLETAHEDFMKLADAAGSA